MQGIDGVMSTAHTLIGYFSSLTQASGQLTEVQVYGILLVYTDYKAVHPIQYVVIR